MDFQPLTETVHHTRYTAIDPSSPANSAAGKVVAISGGAGGIALAIAHGFCIAGASVAILFARRQTALDEASEKLRKEHGTEVWTYSLDIRDGTATTSTFAAIRKRLNADGQTDDMDVLVTCAAALDQGENAIDFDTETIKNSFETNVFGNLNLVRAFLEPETASIPKALVHGIELGSRKNTEGAQVPGRKKVILDVSTAAVHMKVPGSSLYSTSKLGFTHVMRHLQLEVERLPGRPIRISSFHPGAILSPGTRGMGLSEESYPWDDESLPQGFAVWLASPAADLLRGRFVWSCWDVEELVAMRGRFEQDVDFCTSTLKL